MTGRPPLRPVCLIGPPAAGKTTLAEAISRAVNTPVVRPRDVVDRAVSIYPTIADLFPRDVRGHVPDESLGFALRVCLDRTGGLVIFENLPWDTIQLADLYRVSGDRVLVLHLDASDELVRQRRIGRQYCASCYPGTVTSGDGIHCDHCARTLTTRADDDHGAFAERLQIHRTNAAKILPLAHRLGVRIVDLDAARPPGDIVAQVLALIGQVNDRLAA